MPKGIVLPSNGLIDADSQSSSATRIKTRVARTLISVLSERCTAYCMLSGYDRLPDAFDSDIDFMVAEADFERVPAMIDEVARRSGTRLFLSVPHEINARAYYLASLSGDELSVIQPDSTSNYRHFGALWLRADEVLASRRWFDRGFWIPAPAQEFAYYLIKRINKRDFSQEHAARLHRLYVEDSRGCDLIVARFWGGREARAISRMADSNDWAEMYLTLDAFRTTLKSASVESLGQKLASIPHAALHLLGRVVRPTGGWIAFMGPDGCGKSMVIDSIRSQYKFAFRDVQCLHMRPKFLRGNAATGAAVTDPHSKPPRGFVASIAKAFFLFLDYSLGFFFKIVPALGRTHLIVFDRYIYDLLVDSKRVRYGGPRWLLRCIAWIVPRPELVILLDAPAEVLWSRKQEVPFSEVVRQQSAYRKVARGLSSAVIVDAAQPAEAVVHDVHRAIVEFYARRTARRLGLAEQVPAASAFDQDESDH
jgi:thymidylate kinase